MKELLEKFFGVFSDGISLLKEEKSEEAIKKFEEASEMKAELSKEVEDDTETTSEEDIKKFFESDEGKEAVKKYGMVYKFLIISYFNLAISGNIEITC